MLSDFIGLICYPTRIVRYFREVGLFCELAGINSKDFLRYFLQLLLRDWGFHIYRNNMISFAQKISGYDDRVRGWMDNPGGVLIYVLVRHVKPEVVIETGVGPGGTTSFILKALEDNKKGKLFSIDLPGNDILVYPRIGKRYSIHVPNGLETGWLVPPWLKHRHELIIGDSKEKLPALLSKLDTKIDIFMHDSLHTDEHVLFELNTVVPFMRDDGFILCDDVNDYWSLAFIDFCKRLGLEYAVFNNRLGVARFDAVRYGKLCKRILF